MALGIQSAGIADQGIAPQGVIAAPVQEQTVQATEQVQQNNNHADNWLKQDLDNPFIVPWGEFDVTPDFKFNLAEAYGGGKPDNPYKRVIPTGMGGTGGPTPYMGMGQRGGSTIDHILGRPDPAEEARKAAAADAAARTAFSTAHNRINFRDKNLDAAIDALNNSAYNRGNAANSYGWAPVSKMTDAAERSKMFGDVSSKYGIRLDDLQTKYGQYDKAYRTLHEPVGGNWQDLKSSPVYKNLLNDIRQYATDSTSTWGRKGRYLIPGSTNAAYFDRMNAMVPDYRSNPDFLPAEYFVLHQPKAVLSGRGGDNLSDYQKELGRLGNQGTARKGFSALPGHDPYSRQDWSDYADANKAPWQYTPKEIEDAQKAMARHNEHLYSGKLETGGPFNLMKEANVTTPRAKGGKWYWKDSPYTGQLNAAQNMLYHNTQGEKNFRDAGYDENTAVKDSMRFQKKKKKGFMGGLGKVLKPISTIASFIPGPWQLPAQLYMAASSAAEGNMLGAAASLIGANFGGAGTTGNMMGTGASTGAGISNASSLAGRAIGSLGGGTLANMAVKGGLGAMSGFNSDNALKGGLTAALGAGVGDFKPAAIKALGGGLPATTLVNAGIGAGQGAIQGDTALGAILGGMGPMVNAGLNTATGSKALSALGTGVAQGTVKQKAQLDKQKKAIAKAIAQRNRGVA
jgi:hypothetical protein